MNATSFLRSMLPIVAAASVAAGCNGAQHREDRGLNLSGPFRRTAAETPKTPSSESPTQKRQRRAEAAVRRFEQQRDFAEYQSALFSLNHGDPETCESTLRRLCRRNPDHREARLLLAQLAIEEGRNEEAVENLVDLAGRQPLDAQVQHALGLAFDAQGDEASAAACYERASVLAPDEEVYQASLEAAIAAVEPTAPSPDNTVKAMPASAEPLPSEVVPIPHDREFERTLASVFPGSPAAQRTAAQNAVAWHGPAEELPVAAADFVVADGLASSSCLPSREAALARAVEPGRNPDHPVVKPASLAQPEPTAALPTDGERAKDLAEAARQAAKLGRKDEAARHFRRAVAANPYDPQISIQAATCALRLDDADLAAEMARDGLQRHPRSAALHRVLAVTYYRLGDYAGSQVSAQQALSLDKSSALSYFLLGSALARMGQTEAAATHLRQACRLDPRYGRPH